MTDLTPRQARILAEQAMELRALRDRLSRVERSQDTRLTTLRAGDGRGLQVVDENGAPVLQIGGDSSGGGDLIQHVGGPTPEPPSAPLLEAGASTITVSVHDAQPSDLRLCRVHAGLVADFEVGTASILGTIPAGSNSVTIGVPAGEWFVRVQWLTLSGKESAPSDVASIEVEPLVDVGDIEATLATARAELDEVRAALEARRGTVPPTGPDTEGRVYYQVDDTDTPIAVWRYTDGQWVPVPLEDAVFVRVSTDQLVAGMALIGGTLIENGAITTEKLTVTAEMVAEFFRVRKIQAGDINVNNLWADTTWQSLAHFGSEDANYRTEVNGQGLTVWEKGEATDNGTAQDHPIIRVGRAGDNSFSVYEGGEFLGGVGPDGSVKGTSVSSDTDLLIGGREMLGELLNAEIPSRSDSWALLDQLPRGVVAFGERDMSGSNFTSPSHLGFLELSFDGQYDREYQIQVQPYRASSGMFQKIVVTYNGSTPAIDMGGASGREVFISHMPDGFGGGTFRVTPDQTGLVRVLIGVYKGSAGLSFPNATGNVRMSILDIGSRVNDTGIARSSQVVPGSGSSGNDVAPKKSYYSAWQPSWFRSFYNGGSTRQATGKGATMIKQGRDPYWTSGGLQTGLFGGFSGNAIAGERTRTISSALSAADVTSGTIELYAEYVPGGGNAAVRLHWHTLSSVPSSYTMTTGHIGDYSIAQGERRRIGLPADVLAAIKSGTFGGFGLNPRGSTSSTYAIGVGWSVKPTLRIRYER